MSERFKWPHAPELLPEMGEVLDAYVTRLQNEHGLNADEMAELFMHSKPAMDELLRLIRKSQAETGEQPTDGADA